MNEHDRYEQALTDLRNTALKLTAAEKEVERLRAEVATSAGHLAAVEAQLEAAKEACNTRQLAERDGYVSEYIKHVREELRGTAIVLDTLHEEHEELVELRVENAELRESLEWFKRREPLVVNVYNGACDVCVGDDLIKELSTQCQALLRFETVDPKPGAARR